MGFKENRDFWYFGQGMEENPSTASVILWLSFCCIFQPQQHAALEKPLFFCSPLNFAIKSVWMCAGLALTFNCNIAKLKKENRAKTDKNCKSLASKPATVTPNVTLKLCGIGYSILPFWCVKMGSVKSTVKSMSVSTFRLTLIKSGRRINAIVELSRALFIP